MHNGVTEKWGIAHIPVDQSLKGTGVHLSSIPAASLQGTKYFGGGEVLPTSTIGDYLVYSTNRIRSEAQAHHEQWSAGAIALYECVSSLSAKLDTLTIELEELRNAKTFVVPLTSLYPEPLRLTTQLPVTIESYGDEFIATFTEANISASGETEADAIANFKESLAMSFELLASKSPQELGPLPMRQWHILSGVVERI